MQIVVSSLCLLSLASLMLPYLLQFVLLRVHILSKCKACIFLRPAHKLCMQNQLRLLAQQQARPLGDRPNHFTFTGCIRLLPDCYSLPDCLPAAAAVVAPALIKVAKRSLFCLYLLCTWHRVRSPNFLCLPVPRFIFLCVYSFSL